MDLAADSSHVRPTPYPSVNAILGMLLSGAQEILGNRFTGLYLYGSLSSGDFDPERSDIDFLVVTDGELPAPAGPIPTRAANRWSGE